YVIDIGPEAGVNGGQIISASTPDKLLEKETVTAKYLNGSLTIPVPLERRKGNGHFLKLKGAKGNNLKNVSVTFPLGTLICVTGVSGSGKSTLINETLYPVLNTHFFNALKVPQPYDKIEGLEH